MAERELSIQEKRIELTECERVLSEGNEQLLALRTEIKGMEGQNEFGRREREGLADTIAARRGELERLREKLVAQTADLATLSLEKLIEHRDALDEVRHRAFSDLVSERLLADESFTIFQNHLRDEFSAIEARIQEKTASG